MSRFLDLDDADDRAVLTRLVRATMTKDAAETQRMALEFATVTSFGEIGQQGFAQTLVALAGDPLSQQVEVTNLLPSRPEPGDRVAVLSVPPFGAYILGVVQQRAAACVAGHFAFQQDVDWAAYTRQPLFGFDPDDDDGNAESLACGLDLISEPFTAAPNSIEIPFSGTWCAGFQARFSAMDPGDYFGGVLYRSGDVIGGDKVRNDSAAPVVDAWLSSGMRAFYAAAGDQIYVEGEANNPKLPLNGLGISLFSLCCGFTPEEPMDTGTG